jgi:nicotinamide-nucleotide amidase
MDTELVALADQLGQKLKSAGHMLVTAESCTGGWLGEVLTAMPGSSHWYDRGFITYTNTAKREMLGVKTEILTRFGAVSEVTARAMAEGALANSHAEVSVAITGIAGPGGGTPEKPVGTVCFAWAMRRQGTRLATHQFHGDREAVRRQAVRAALEGLHALISVKG